MKKADTESVKQIDIALLVESKWNRADLGNGDLKSLSENIAVDGVLVPLIVRPMPDGDPESNVVEIVAGHRRRKAAMMAGLKEVPCIVRVMDDTEAKKVQVLENLHRKDLNPMEEAKAFKGLMEGNAHSAQTIADYVDKDVKYVHRALSLLSLPAKAIKALEKGILSAAHGHQLARVGPKQIDTLVEYAIKPGWKGELPTLAELKAEIGRRVEKDLGAAPFVKDKEYAGKVACKGCPSNTANQNMLFDGAEAGHCTNSTCFSAKLHQFYKDLQATGEKRWPNLQFIGMARSSYGSSQTIKGYRVTEAADPKVKKAIEFKADPKVTLQAHPTVAGYGFGILLPSNWGNIKVPKLVVLKKMAKSEERPNNGYSSQPDPEVTYMWRYIRDYRHDNGAELERLHEAAQKEADRLEKEAKMMWKKNKKTIMEEYKKEDGVKKS